MFIRPSTDAMFGTPDQTMNYKKYRKVIQAGMDSAGPPLKPRQALGRVVRTGYPLGALEVKCLSLGGHARQRA
jgi:hypothetical protein